MQFTSSDVEQVEATWQQFVPSASLQRVDPRSFRFEWRSAELAGMTLVDYELAAQVHSRAEPLEQLLVCRVDAPDARVWSGRQALDPGSPWLSDGTPVEAQWSRTARVRGLVFERRIAEQQARQLTGHDTIDLRATGLSPHTAATGAAWERMFRYVGSSVGPEGTDDAILVAEYARHALLTTLASFPNTFTEALRRPAQRTGAPATVRRALLFIDENAHLPITVDDVAMASFISTRGLQYAFRRALDMTPADALRRARLDGARRDLQAGDGTSVSAIARRWGFTHVSRFTTAYREAYGTAPAVNGDRD